LRPANLVALRVQGRPRGPSTADRTWRRRGSLCFLRDAGGRPARALQPLALLGVRIIGFEHDPVEADRADTRFGDHANSGGDRHHQTDSALVEDELLLLRRPIAIRKRENADVGRTASIDYARGLDSRVVEPTEPNGVGVAFVVLGLVLSTLANLV
jgi:hypothetical protein